LNSPPRASGRQIGDDAKADAAGDAKRDAEAERPAVLKHQYELAHRSLEHERVRVRCQLERHPAAPGVDQIQIMDKRRAAAIRRQPRRERGEPFSQLDIQCLACAAIAVDQQARATITEGHILQLDAILQNVQV